MRVTLLGLEFFINNLGCEALSYSFVSELHTIAGEQNKELDLVTVVYADQKKTSVPGMHLPIRCLKIRYQSPAFWQALRREFRSSDFIVDFTMGDSFSDLYGMKRFALDAMVKTAAIHSKTPFVLGPQTYGPYHNKMVKKWAAWILKKASQVYTRDEQSQKIAEQLSGREVLLTTDVAFALQPEKKEIHAGDKIKVGMNPSGLLWNGGYTGENQFGLTIDYQKYCLEVCDALNRDPRYEIYLIPHVGTIRSEDANCENDIRACLALQEKYPSMKLIEKVSTPMAMKGYLAEMDVFVGARMHATIGAFSSGVATIPVSYSRKFEGLYGSLHYDYLIHALTMSTDEAIAVTLQYIEDYQHLKTEVAEAMKLVRQRQEIFRESLRELMNEKTV